MLFAHTIRRKMVFGLALVLVMLITLSLSGISGLLSYRSTVKSLEMSLYEAPRRDELASTVADLFQPLLLTPPAFQREEFGRQLERTHAELATFQRKLDRLPPRPDILARKRVMEQSLGAIHERLAAVQKLAVALSDPKQRPLAVERMLIELGHIQILADGIPDAQAGLNATLQNASQAYQTRFWWVCGTSIAGVVMFIFLVRTGYHGIFSPLCKLHQGARRVAQGDFNYRLKLNTNDEMAELAESFNNMTDRFQEIAEDLDRQVRERFKQLVRSERLAGIGFLSAGVAHEINNPLSAISMASESLLDQAPRMFERCDPADVEIAREYLQMIQSEAQRCQTITHKLLDFARGQDAVRTRNDLTQIVSEVLAMIRHMSKFRDRIIEFHHPTPCYAEVNGPEIKQVVLNIVANALEATESGGRLAIDIAERPDNIVITFCDNGCGMTPEVIENLFEPFFTQKKYGKGTGLGMAISNRIIADHGGRIEASSDGCNCGSTFRIHLPKRAARSTAA